MGFYRAWLFGEQAIDHMDAMTAPDGYPRAEVWLPLNVSGTSGDGPKQWQSAWVQCPPDKGEVWLEFGLPTQVITEHLGPHALISDFGLGCDRALRSDVQRRDGQWMVKVPRFFDTVTEHWTTEPQDGALLTTTDGQSAACTTVGALDVETSRDRFRNEPELIVGPEGPVVFGPLDYRYRSTLDWEKRLDAGPGHAVADAVHNASDHGLVPVLRKVVPRALQRMGLRARRRTAHAFAHVSVRAFPARGDGAHGDHQR